MKGVQCYELFGGITLKIHTFHFIFQGLVGVAVDHLGIVSVCTVKNQILSKLDRLNT